MVPPSLFQGAVIVAIVALIACFVWARPLRPRLRASGDLPADVVED